MHLNTNNVMEINYPNKGQIGVELIDCDVRVLDPNSLQQILSLVYKYKLVVLRGQSLSKDDYLEFARQLGTPQIYPNPNYHHPDYSEIFVSSNVPEKGKKIGVAGAGSYWHTDCQFLEKPLSLTLVLPQILPTTGERATLFIDMAQAYYSLPEHLKLALDGVDAIHEGKWHYKVQAHDIDKSIFQILQEFVSWAPSVRHPAIIQHPVTQEKALYISSGFTTGIENLSYEDSRALLVEVFEFIERPENIHKQLWCEEDLLIWDNRALLHKALKSHSNEKSVSYRIGVFDRLPFY
jgi:taurine dioxygenase